MFWGIVIFIAVLVYAIWLYNRLVHDRNTALAAWSDIDVQLKRRHDLIPKLVDAVKAYAAYEQATLARITELRRSGEVAREARQDVSESPGARGQAEGRLSQALHGVLALAEDYPDLKTSTQFTGLQDDISGVEADIQYARRYYNGAVKAYNVRVESFPSNLVAALFNFRRAEYFDWEPS